MSPAPATTTPGTQAGKPTEAMTVKGQEGAVIWSKIRYWHAACATHCSRESLID